MTDLCTLIQDLIPLYHENDVSPETRKSIEEHLKTCSRCAAAAEEFALSSEPIAMDVLPDPLDTTGGYKKFIGRMRRFVLGALAFAVICASLVGAASFWAGMGMKKTITYVKAQEDVYRYYSEKVPGLERARREGSYQNIGREIALPDGMGTAYFDNIWYAPEKIYVFYHIVPKGDLGRLEDVQLSGTLYWDILHDGRTIFSPSFSGGMNLGEWVSFEGRYFGVMAFNNERQRFVPLYEAAADKLALNLRLTHIPKSNLFNHKQDHIDIGEIQFSVLSDPSREKVYTLNLDKHIDIKEGVTLKFTKLEAESQKTIIFMELSAPGNIALASLTGTIITDAGEEIKLWPSPAGTGANSYRFEIDPLNYVPADITFEIDEAQLVTKEMLSFDLGAGEFHGKMENVGIERSIGKSLGNRAGAEYVLESLYADDRGLSFTLLMEYDGSDKSGNMITLNSWAHEQVYLDHPETDKTDPGRLVPNLVRITNERGETAQIDDYGQSGAGPGSRMSMFIDKGFVERSETITVDIFNLIEVINLR